MANGAEPAVRRALEAAAVECITDYWCAQDWQQAEARREAAAAIAAFLRALPCCDVMMQRWTNDDPPERDGPHSTITLAAAVEAAAREGA